MLAVVHLHMKTTDVCIKTRSPSASLSIQGQVTKYTTVKWPIEPKNVRIRTLHSNISFAANTAFAITLGHIRIINTIKYLHERFEPQITKKVKNVLIVDLRRPKIKTVRMTIE